MARILVMLGCARTRLLVRDMNVAISKLLYGMDAVNGESEKILILVEKIMVCDKRSCY